jgi:hypothetical protein
MIGNKISDSRCSKKKLSLAMREQADQVLVHQCVVRRFKNSQPEAFAALRNMRIEIQNALELDPVSYFPAVRPCRLDTSIALVGVMHLFNTSSGRNALLRAAEFELDEVFQISGLEPLQQLTVSSSRKILLILVQHVKVIQKLQAQFRFFDIYSVLAMSVYVEASELVKRYYFEYSRVRRDADGAGYSGLLAPELGWLSLLRGSRESEDVELLLGTGIASPFFVSDTLEIFDDELNSVVVNGVTMKNGLYLRVQLDDEAPHQIDSALVYLRSSLLEKARERGIMRAVYTGYSFEKSNFVMGMRKPLFFDVKRSSHLGLLLGLMCFDRMNTSHRSSEDIFCEVIEEVEKFCLKEKLAGSQYSEETVRKNYKKIASAIRFSGKNRTGMLDLFLTGSKKGLDSDNS